MLIDLIRVVYLNLKKESLIKQQHKCDKQIQTLSLKKSDIKKEYDALVKRLGNDKINVFMR